MQAASAHQVEVTLLVCCPAKSAAMSIPHTWSSVSAVPFLYRASMKDWSMSSWVWPEAFRSRITLVKMLASSARARSRLKCA